MFPKHLTLMGAALIALVGCAPSQTGYTTPRPSLSFSQDDAARFPYSREDTQTAFATCVYATTKLIMRAGASPSAAAIQAECGAFEDLFYAAAFYDTFSEDFFRKNPGTRARVRDVHRHNTVRIIVRGTFNKAYKAALRGGV